MAGFYPGGKGDGKRGDDFYRLSFASFPFLGREILIEVSCFSEAEKNVVYLAPLPSACL